LEQVPTVQVGGKRTLGQVDEQMEQQNFAAAEI